jgi:uncharacterized protein (TIGR00297 family)
MVLTWELSLVGVVATGILSAIAVRTRALTPGAGVVAAAFGSVIVILGGFGYLSLLVLFVFASVAATRYGFEQKERRHVQEGRAGERGIANVVAHIVLPTALVVAILPLSWIGSPPTTIPFLYVAALAFGTSDTFASEFGVLSGRARSLLTGKAVESGTNGGVSWIGTAWAVVGAGATAFAGWALLAIFSTPEPGVAFVFPAGLVAGFLGCQVDSVLGELLENRGYLSKGSTNFLGMLSSIGIGFLLTQAVPGVL